MTIYGEYTRVLAAHEWERASVDSPIRFYTHPSLPMDRIHLFNAVWSHCHFDGQSWLVTPKTRGADAASLDAYLTKHFRSTSATTLPNRRT